MPMREVVSIIKLGASVIHNLPFASLELLEVSSSQPLKKFEVFRGLRGTVQVVDIIDIPDDLHCFYLVTLEGAYTREPVWFEYDEVENASIVTLQSPSEPGQGVMA